MVAAFLLAVFAMVAMNEKTSVELEGDIECHPLPRANQISTESSPSSHTTVFLGCTELPNPMERLAMATQPFLVMETCTHCGGPIKVPLLIETCLRICSWRHNLVKHLMLNYQQSHFIFISAVNSSILRASDFPFSMSIERGSYLKFLFLCLHFTANSLPQLPAETR